MIGLISIAFRGLRILWTDTLFELITFKFGAFLLLVTGSVVPFGQHRIFMRVEGWFIFPMAFGFVALGAYLWQNGYGPGYRVLCIPYYLFLASDCLEILLSAKPSTRR